MTKDAPHASLGLELDSVGVSSSVDVEAGENTSLHAAHGDNVMMQSSSPGNCLEHSLEVEEYTHVLEDTRIDTHAHDHADHEPQTSWGKTVAFLQRYSIPLQLGIVLALATANLWPDSGLDIDFRGYQTTVGTGRGPVSIVTVLKWHIILCIRGAIDA